MNFIAAAATRLCSVKKTPISPWVAGATLLMGSLSTSVAFAKTPTSSDDGKSEVTIGAGVAVAPRYLGADESRAIPVAVVAWQRGRYFADIVRGIGVEHATQSGLYMSAALGYDLGRSTKDSVLQPGSKKLAGMGDVRESATLDLTVALPITSWVSVNAEAELKLLGQRDRGNQYRVGLHSDLLENERDTVTLDVSAHFSDSDYAKTYFGVSAIQSERSTFARYDAGSGLYGYSLLGTWTHSFNSHYSITTAVKVMELTGDAGRSSLVREKTAVTGMASLNYTF
ncbi:MipA/OmpV family protein [Stenotrophomonas maltophilia]|uniref:MipA/OmpV family protein n=1 Tax=Stenotrophomonas maltophilia TaxID=40324 RepID=UPI0021C15EF2|nr:MipA/OmpV family protein [Stenotrophomonas maltophilia]UXL28951.1 MipA/OmpV family protein [Stenotrophomonas maltophilia]